MYISSLLVVLALHPVQERVHQRKGSEEMPIRPGLQYPSQFLPSIHCTLDTSASLRLVAAEAILVCLNCESFEPLNLDTDTCGDLLEDVIKLTTRDGCTNVRRARREIFGVYKIVFPERIEGFVLTLLLMKPSLAHTVQLH